MQFSNLFTHNSRSTSVDRIINDLADQFSLWNSILDETVWKEHEGVFSTELDAAGYKREEISIEVADDVITITAENKRRGKKSRAFYLRDLDADKITAKLEDGVLALSVPKRADALPRKVTVQ